MSPSPTRKPANVDPESPTKPASSLTRLQGPDSSKSQSPPLVSATQQPAQRDGNAAVSSVGGLGDGGEKEECQNDTAKSSFVQVDLIDRHEIQGCTEDGGPLVITSERIKDRRHEEAEISDDEAGSEAAAAAAADSLALDRILGALCPLSRPGKRNWKSRRETEDETSSETSKKRRTQTFSAAAHTGPLGARSGENSYGTAQDDAEVEAGGQRTLHTPLRPGRQKWQLWRRKEDGARMERKGHDRIRALGARGQTGAYRPSPNQLVPENSRLAIWQRLEAVEKSQRVLREQLARDKSELALQHREWRERQKVDQ